jgi:hypothetical protein
MVKMCCSSSRASRAADTTRAAWSVGMAASSDAEGPHLACWFLVGCCGLVHRQQMHVKMGLCEMSFGRKMAQSEYD